MPYADFDAAIEAANAEPLTIKLFDQEWQLPGVMPAVLPLRMARWMQEGRGQDDLTNGELLDLARDLFPDDVLDAWLAKGLDIDVLGDIIKWVAGKYMGTIDDDPGADPSGEASAPSSSSSDGDSSKPTSPASTGSTSAAG